MKYDENGFCKLDEISLNAFLASSGDKKQGREVEKGQNTLPIFETFIFNGCRIGVSASYPQGYTYNQMWHRIINRLCRDGKEQMLIDYCTKINADGNDGWLKYLPEVSTVGDRVTVDIPGADYAKDALRGYELGNGFVLIWINNRWIHTHSVEAMKELGLDIWVKPTGFFKKFIDNTSK